ncbi:MAG: DUF1631 family protein [Burkholderiaceae bacterium]|nr:DUF1631 family protein [Burkholderiaceae bacterium]
MSSSGDVFLTCVRSAAVDGTALMKGLLDAGRPALFERASSSMDPRDRNLLQESLRLLNHREDFLCRRFPELLLAEFTATGAPAPKPVPVAEAELRFDLLELMDETQVQDRVEVARIQQAVLLATDAELAELNRLVCGALGLERVYVDRNPLRPEVYARSLHEVLRQTGAAAPTRVLWLQVLGQALGQSLVSRYQTISRSLRDAGVVPAPYHVTQAAGTRAGSPGVSGRGGWAPSNTAPTLAQGPAAPGSGRRSGATLASLDVELTGEFGDTHSATLLTLSHLRQLLAGELPDESPAPGSAAQPTFSERHGAPSAPTFAPTVPAAFEALAEMQQVDQVMQRLTRRTALTAGRPAETTAVALESESAVSLRASLRLEARGMGQALGLEVVSLMVENIVNDARLAPSVRNAVGALEPALLRLAMADPRFFSDRQHAARQLLDQVTQRALGFASEKDDGFVAFLEPVQSAVEALASAQAVSPELFSAALSALQEDWETQARRSRQLREQALQALLQAERRQQLAEQISREMREREALQLAPSPVVALLLGPWSQVIARDRLANPEDGIDPGGYAALVADLLWSTRIDLDRAGRERLLKLIPGLIARLREGLSGIDYPAERLQEFLDLLMSLHQKALKPAGTKSSAPPAAATPAPDQPAADSPLPLTRDELQAHFDAADASEVWIVGKEAQDSGFMDYEADAAVADSTIPQALDADATPASEPAQLEALTRLGAWVELSIEGHWERLQLTWSSPQGSLFLFSRVGGTAHSMTRRTLEKLAQGGQLRLVAARAVVDGALDAVAQTALRNSIDGAAPMASGATRPGKPT